VYEYSTTAIAGGAAKGTRDAGIAIAAARALGYPTGCTIAFAVDEDISANPSAVDAYARAFTMACHAAGYRSMDYGGLATVKRCADLGLTDLHWQTYAWSGRPTVWDPRVAIRQTQNAVTIAGRQVDLDTAMVDDFGAWSQEAQMEQTDIVIGAFSRGNSVGDVFSDETNLRDEWYLAPGASSKNPPPAGSRFDLLMQAVGKVNSGDLGVTVQVTQDQVNTALLQALQNPAVLQSMAAAFAAHFHVT
jgi:hypothetical protein